MLPKDIYQDFAFYIQPHVLYEPHPDFLALSCVLLLLWEIVKKSCESTRDLRFISLLSLLWQASQIIFFN